MRRALNGLVLGLVALGMAAVAEAGFAPYKLVGEVAGAVPDLAAQVETAVGGAGFQVVGKFSPGDKPDAQMVVICTHPMVLQAIAQSGDNTGFAAGLRIGLWKNKAGKVEISYENPEYIQHAYFGKKVIAQLASTVSKRLGDALATVAGGNQDQGFGGNLDGDDLAKYHYMVGMQRFGDVVTAGEFASFQEAVSTIDANLAAGKGGNKLVYKIQIPGQEMVDYGVAMDHERKYLDIIGSRHIAAQPYSLLVVGKKAVTLHGRYRIALHWPELTMTTFTKIITTPGNIADSMKAVCSK
ncbi:MAG: hypothetical protein GW783_01790 [Deltaproteobacteria bacterium]|nr:hypothetical protein [Deltaproteobacteria bacterium]NCP96728.1 hypothetical protein [Deltaproteobacteria bacterium]NCS72846.1 hypothetical protein [Deltaproteobacteria bacterium]